MSTVLVRAAADPVGLLRPMLQTVRNLDDAIPVVAAKTLTQHIAESLGTQRALGALLGALGVLGLGLASLGLYAVVSFAVSRRSREIGIRMTLGARQTRVIWVLSKSVAKLLAVGVTLGLALSWVALQVLAAVVSDLDQQAGAATLTAVPDADLMTFALVLLLMAAVGLAATFFPAWRATRGNPLVAVRHL